MGFYCSYSIFQVHTKAIQECERVSCKYEVLVLLTHVMLAHNTLQLGYNSQNRLRLCTEKSLFSLSFLSVGHYFVLLMSRVLIIFLLRTKILLFFQYIGTDANHVPNISDDPF